MTVESGNFFMLQFDGALTITHGSGIELPGAANLTTAAGDRLICYATAANTVEVLSVELETAPSSGLTVAAEQATTSGNDFTFGSIPSGTTLIFVQWEGVSLDDTDNLQVQIGDSGGIETSGYVSSSQLDDTSGASSTAAFNMITQNASGITNGHMILTLFSSSTWSWVASHSVANSTTASAYGGGTKSLSAELTQVKILDSAGDAFDAGAVTVSYL
jgi:hypothetical protein